MVSGCRKIRYSSRRHPGQLTELPDSQGLDVTLAAPVEIARGAVVQGVLMAPVSVGG